MLNGKIALVTGAASGIGRAISRAYAREGAHVVGVDRNAMADSEMLGLVADITDPEQVRGAVSRSCPSRCDRAARSSISPRRPRFRTWAPGIQRTQPAKAVW